MRAYVVNEEALLSMLAPSAQVSAAPLPGEQRSGQWFSERTGKLTASRMAEAMAFLKNGKPAAERKKLMRELLGERLTDQIATRHVTPAMQWGIDNEGAAKEAYTAKTGRAVTPCAFFDHPTIENFGATPDALVGVDGLLETKCPTTAVHLDYLLDAVVPEEYQPQMTAQLLCTGRQWCDFVSYDPRLPPRQRVFLIRFQPDDEYRKKVEDAAVQFLSELDALFDQVSTIEHDVQITGDC